MKKIVMLIGVLLIALSLISCGGGGISDSVNGSSYDTSWTGEEDQTINTNINNLGLKYSTYDNYDMSTYYLTNNDNNVQVKVIIAKKNTNFTATLYSQEYVITKIGNNKYDLNTNGTTTTYTSLQTAFSVIYMFK